jgi:hypothetical protein
MGNSLIKASWTSPLVTLYESWTDEEEPPPSPEAILTDWRAPGIKTSTSKVDAHAYGNNVDETTMAWPTMPGPGFIFGCRSDTMDECFGRGIFGLPAHVKAAAASGITGGATIFYPM